METKPADKLASATGTNTPDHGQVTVGRGKYGTQKQTALLVNVAGHVTFVERTLFGEDGEPPAPDQRVRTYEFDIEGWDA